MNSRVWLVRVLWSAKLYEPRGIPEYLQNPTLLEGPVENGMKIISKMTAHWLRRGTLIFPHPLLTASLCSSVNSLSTNFMFSNGQKSCSAQSSDDRALLKVNIMYEQRVRATNARPRSLLSRRCFSSRTTVNTNPSVLRFERDACLSSKRKDSLPLKERTPLSFRLGDPGIYGDKIPLRIFQP